MKIIHKLIINCLVFYLENNLFLSYKNSKYNQTDIELKRRD